MSFCQTNLSLVIIRSRYGGCHRGVMVKATECRIVVSKFEFQSRYYIRFRTNTLWKGMNHLILPVLVKIVPVLF